MAEALSWGPWPGDGWNPLAGIGESVSGAAPSTIWAAVSALATCVTAWVAIVTLLALKQDSRDRTRPVMTAELVHSVLSPNYELHIINRGQSVAWDVQVAFDPPLPVLSGAAAAGLMTPFVQRRYAEPIPTIAPGTVFDNLYGAPDHHEPVPDNFVVQFDYQDEHRRHYHDEFALSLDAVRAQTGAYPSSTSSDGMRKRRTKALEAIARGVGRH